MIELVPPPAQLEQRYAEVEAKIRASLPEVGLALFRKVYEFAASAHSKQFRKSGEPYIGHPLEVASITADMRVDQTSLFVALLHDTVEDTDVTLADLTQNFGAEVAELVDGLTKISRLDFKSREEAQAENIRKLIISMGNDVRVILVKLADRLHNIRTLNHMAPEKQRRIAQETIEIYAPLANRLGINWVKNELEDFSFRYLNPEAYAALKLKIAQTRAERDAYTREVSGFLKELVRSQNIKAEVQGRPKHFYSIWKKMEDSQVDFEQVHDLTAFRVIVESQNTCYEVLGLVHDVWKPVAGRFKDYIGVPKSNGYRSLHTTVVGPRGQQVEIQIRTQEMHGIAENGVAAHWAYKEKRGKIDPKSNPFAGLREFVQTQMETESPREFLDTVKLDLCSDEVFVFTPRGDIISLPKGATPLDFAYAIHSEVGNHATHATVNGRGVGLRHELANGDHVEIITRSDQYPREEWVDIVKSGRAKAKIRQFIRKGERDRAREVARNLLTAELKRYGLKYESVLRSGELRAAAEGLKVQNVEQLLVAVGYGRLSKEQVVAKIVPPELTPRTETGSTSAVRRLGERIAQMIGRPDDSVVKIAGMAGEVLVSYARCCNPVFGEEIVGYVTRGRGIVVHLRDCPRIHNLEEERRIDVEWERLGGNKSADANGDAMSRRVSVKVVCRDEKGILSSMSAAFSSRGVNIAHAHCRTTAEGIATNTFDLLVSNVRQLNEAINTVQKIEGVIRVQRVQG